MTNAASWDRAPPLIPVPAPRATKGSPSRAASRTSAATSSTVVGKAMASTSLPRKIEAS